MVTYKHRGWLWSTVVIEYEPEDRYSDCLEWVRPYYPLVTSSDYKGAEAENIKYLVLALLVIKLRIRVAAARNAWKDTVKIFLKTKQGEELEPVKSILEEYFALSDDTVQPEQIRQLMSIVHVSCPYIFEGQEPLEGDLKSDVYDNALTCLRRTWKGSELLSAELNSGSFATRRNNLREATRLAQELEDIGMMRSSLIVIASFYIFILTLARFFLIPRDGKAFAIGNFITRGSWGVLPLLLHGVGLCAYGAIVGPIRSWTQCHPTLMWATVVSLGYWAFMIDELRVLSLLKTLATKQAFAQYLTSIVDKQALPVCVVNLVLWWKVVPTPISADFMGTRVFISALFLIFVIYTGMW